MMRLWNSSCSGVLAGQRERGGGRENGRERGVQCTCIKKELSARGHLVHVYMYLWPAAHTG